GVRAGRAPAACGGRLGWLVRWLGHPAPAVLSGGFAAGPRAGRAVSDAVVVRPPRAFRAAAAAGMLCDGAQLEAALAGGALRDGATVLVDARPADRFRGENETLDPVAGHVPGARSRPFAANHDASGRWREPQALRPAW